MKKTISVLLALCLMLTAGMVVAESPEAGSLNVERVSIRGNASWTKESYPEIWITPVFAEYIIKGNEKYPAHFLHFAPPEGALPTSFAYDEAVFLDHDILAAYYYFAYDRHAFELFLEKADPEFILEDGSDGVAMYISPDSRRARALIDISDNFGGTAKLEIVFDDYSRDITTEQLTGYIQAEVERVQAAMTFVELDQYWSEGVFGAVELHAGNDPVSVLLDAASLTIVSLKESKLKAQELVDGDVRSIELALDSYSYVYSNEEEAEDITLSDGTEWKIYHTGYTGYAVFVVMEVAKYDRPLYLTVQSDCAPEDFVDVLEAINSLVTINVE